MKPQKILAVISTIGRSHQGVDMKFCRQGVGEEHTRVVIKFSHDHGTLNAIVKRVVLLGATDPRKIGLVQVVLNFFDSRFVGPLGQGLNKRLHQIQESTLLRSVELSRRNPLVGNDAIVLHGPTQVQLIGFVATTLGQIATHT